MDLIEAKRLARSLMRESHLFGMTFDFDRSVTSFGKCHFKRNTYLGTITPFKITLSKVLTENASPEQVRETMLHEIAHAVAGYEAGHGAAFRSVARSLGIPGNRCGVATVEQKAAIAELHKWGTYCSHCRKPGTSRFHRKPRANRICATCKNVLRFIPLS